jgi:hypothetical protein
MPRNEGPVAEANRAYFVTFANSRASLGRLPALALLVGFLLLVCNIGPLNAPKEYVGYEALAHLSAANVILIWMCVVVFGLSMFKGLTLRFQIISSACMTGMAVMLVYALCLLTLPMATLLQARGERIYAILFDVGGLLSVVLIVSAMIVHVVLLRRRLVMGHSERRTIGNFRAIFSSNRLKVFWVACGVAVIVPNVVTQGQYVGNTLGAAALIFLGAVMPGLAVECAYLTHLKTTDRGYWERLPDKQRNQRQRR